MEEKELTYRSAMEELESIIAFMESDNCDIDRLAEYTTRATRLMRFCKQTLFDTNKEVEKCLEELRGLAAEGIS